MSLSRRLFPGGSAVMAGAGSLFGSLSMSTAHFAALSLLLLLLGSPAIAIEPGLKIALTNDDGWQADGIQALFRSLTQAGHDVILVAPADQQSGSSAAFNAGKLRVVREAESQFSLHVCDDDACTSTSGAEPATSALVAVDLVRRSNGGTDPDILVSGANEGANLGSATQMSGTVGAAVAASSPTMGGSVPAIAVSTNIPADCEGNRDCTDRHYERVGKFVARLVAHLAANTKDGARILPDGLVLNVNYPAVEARGVRVVAQDPAMTYNGTAIRVDFGCESCLDLEIGDSAEAAMLGFSEYAADLADDGELASFAAGYVTIVPMHIDYTAADYKQYAGLFTGIERD